MTPPCEVHSLALKLRNLLLGLSLLCASAVHAAHWDVEYWQDGNMTNWESGPCKLYTFAELRFNHDASKFYYFRLSECFAYQARPWLDLEAHYGLIYNKPRGSSKFKTVQRLELEVNPSYVIDERSKIIWRNRVEFLKSQGSSKITTVLRHRPRFVYSFENCGCLVSAECSDEVFYNCTTTTFTQNRLIPIQLSFRLSSRVTADIFFMVRNFHESSTNEWYRSFVLGSVVYF